MVSDRLPTAWRIEFTLWLVECDKTGLRLNVLPVPFPSDLIAGRVSVLTVYLPMCASILLFASNKV